MRRAYNRKQVDIQTNEEVKQLSVCFFQLARSYTYLCTSKLPGAVIVMAMEPTFR